MVDVEIKPENLDCIPYIEIKPEILNFVPVESNNDHESLSAIPIKVEADDPLNSFHEGYYVIQCKCYVMVKRSDKSVQCNLYEEEIETKEISIVNIENTNNIIDTNENNYNDVTVDYEEDNTNNIIETNAYNDNNVTVDYDNITCNSISESSEDETKFEELFAKTEKIYEEAYTLVNGGYKCNKCGKISGNRGKFLRHSVSHQEHSTLCYGCGKLYSKNDSTHIAICSSLNKRKNNEKNVNVLTEYKRQERGSLEIRQCRDCGKRIKSILEGNDHQNIHKNLKPYQCSCGSKCRYFSNFIIHLKKFKCPIDKCIIPEYAPQNIQLWIDRESKYKPIFGNYANKKITNAYRTKKLLPDSELNCKECGIEKFPNYVRYREHLESKHLERKFVCKDKRCGHKFATERKLRDHVKNIHLIQHKCDKCNLVFSRTKLKRHNLTCAGLNMEKITVSNYKTTFRNQLFYCSICTEHEEHQKINKHFSHDYHKKLEELWKQKHNIKQYKCTKCKYLTKRSINNFFIHLEHTHKFCFIIQINDIFKSFESDQPFIFNVDIEEHLERKFVCKDKRCGHKFATEKNLRDHVKNIHLIQHKCDKCNLVFARIKFKRHNLTCAGLNMEKITVSNYKTTYRNQLFYCSICTEHEEHQKINKHFSHDYHKKLEELWKQKHNIKQYKCTKCKYLTKESICDFFIHLEKIHKCCFILQINDIFKSFESAQPFIFNDDIEEPDRMDIAIDE